MKKSLPLNRQEGLVVQELNGEVLIYDIKENKALCLNETSALVWRLCDGENSVTDISQSIGKQLNSPADEDLVWLALDQLKKENLIANFEEVVPNYNGLSRREVIKKVGLSTMLAIPVILSLDASALAGAGGNQSRVRPAICATPSRCVGGPTDSCAIVPTCPGNSTLVGVGVCFCANIQGQAVGIGVEGQICATALVCVG